MSSINLLEGSGGDDKFESRGNSSQRFVSTIEKNDINQGCPKCLLYCCNQKLQSVDVIIITNVGGSIWGSDPPTLAMSVF